MYVCMDVQQHDILIYNFERTSQIIQLALQMKNLNFDFFAKNLHFHSIALYCCIVILIFWDNALILSNSISSYI